MTASHEKMAALRVAGLHAADRNWILRQLPAPSARRLRLLLAHPTIRAATAAGITVDQLPRPTHSEPVPVVPAADALTDRLADHVADWHPDWLALVYAEADLPPALADSLRSYRKDVLKESA
jgi:hypothetical protein